MKLGYPDTINNKAYQGEKSPFKMVDKSKADLDKDGKVSDYEENRAEAAFGSEAPLNYSPLQVREMSAKRRARRKKRVDKIEAKANSIAEQKYTEGVADEDLPSTAKKSKVKKYNRLTKKADRISAKTTKILRKNNQVPSAKKGFEKKDYGGKDDKFDPKTMKPPTRKKKSPVKAKDIVADNQAKRKAIAEKAKKAEAAIRESESSSKSSEPTAEPAKKKTKLGRAIQARKERRAKKNPKVKERQEGNATRKKNKKDNKYAIKTQKSLVTKERQDKKTKKAVTRQTERLEKVTKKVGEKIEDVNKGTGLGIGKSHPAVGNIVKNIVTAKNKKNKK